jgi:hypothetical protein
LLIVKGAENLGGKPLPVITLNLFRVARYIGYDGRYVKRKLFCLTKVTLQDRYTNKTTSLLPNEERASGLKQELL